jgi:hypothetical protein
MVEKFFDGFFNSHRQKLYHWNKAYYGNAQLANEKGRIMCEAGRPSLDKSEARLEARIFWGNPQKIWSTRAFSEGKRRWAFESLWWLEKRTALRALCVARLWWLATFFTTENLPLKALAVESPDRMDFCTFLNFYWFKT